MILHQHRYNNGEGDETCDGFELKITSGALVKRERQGQWSIHGFHWRPQMGRGRSRVRNMIFLSLLSILISGPGFHSNPWWDWGFRDPQNSGIRGVRLCVSLPTLSNQVLRIGCIYPKPILNTWISWTKWGLNGTMKKQIVHWLWLRLEQIASVHENFSPFLQIIYCQNSLKSNLPNEEGNFQWHLRSPTNLHGKSTTLTWNLEQKIFTQ